MVLRARKWMSASLQCDASVIHGGMAICDLEVGKAIREGKIMKRDGSVVF